MAVTPETAYVAVGSNIEPERHILAGAQALARRARVTGVSTFYRTAAIARPDQPRYLNGVLEVSTDLAPVALKFDVLRAIEEQEGRVRVEDRYAPRTLDLDILLYGHNVINSDGLRIPDPDLWERDFLSASVLELDPGLVVPGLNKPLARLARPESQARLAPDEAFTRLLKEQMSQ